MCDLYRKGFSAVSRTRTHIHTVVTYSILTRSATTYVRLTSSICGWKKDQSQSRELGCANALVPHRRAAGRMPMLLLMPLRSDAGAVVPPARARTRTTPKCSTLGRADALLGHPCCHRLRHRRCYRHRRWWFCCLSDHVYRRSVIPKTNVTAP